MFIHISSTLLNPTSQLNDFQIFTYDLLRASQSHVPSSSVPTFILFHKKTHKVLLMHDMTERRALYNFETLLQCDMFDLREEGESTWIIERDLPEENDDFPEGEHPRQHIADYAKSDCLILIVGLEWHTHFSSTINSFSRVIWNWIRERQELQLHDKALKKPWSEDESSVDLARIPLIVLYDGMKDEFVFKYRDEESSTEIIRQHNEPNVDHSSSQTPSSQESTSTTVSLTYEYSIEQAKRDHELLAQVNEELKNSVQQLKEQLSMIQSQLQIERNEHTVTTNQLKHAEDKLIHHHVAERDLKKIEQRYIEEAHVLRLQLQEAHDQSLVSTRKRLATHLHNYFVSKSRTLRSNFDERAQFFHQHITEKDLKKIELRYKEHIRMLLSRYAACLEILTSKQIPPINVTGHIGFSNGIELQREIVQGAQFESKLLHSVETFTGPIEDVITPNIPAKRLRVIREDIERHKRRLSVGSSSATSPQTPTSRRLSRANSLKISTARQFNGGASSEGESILSSSPRSLSPSSKMLATPGSPTGLQRINSTPQPRDDSKVQQLEQKLEKKDATIFSLTETVALQQKQIMSLMQQLEEKKEQ